VKPGPIIAMIALIAVGMWLVLQPALARSDSDYEIRVGGTQILVDDSAEGLRILEPRRLATQTPIDQDTLNATVARQVELWAQRPAFERTLLGFFNISTWGNFAWVAVGLVGQCAFFGRMFIQWIVSEKNRRSEVPELFWWFSFIGGVCLFTYFVWRVDVVGVLGQSTGVVIYARNLRLIHKQRRREARYAPAVPEPGSRPETGDTPDA
jgi:lipid-A-disaccharide synthase-like uncharacterized protein